jgi:hypothetical protein
MDSLKPLTDIFQSGVMPVLLLGIVLWNSDKVLSKNGAKALYSAIEQTAQKPSESEISNILESFLSKYFSLKNGLITFTFNVFLLTLTSLLCLLSIYAYKTQGLSERLLTEGFLTQFIGHGFVITLVINYFTFAAYPLFIRSFSSDSLACNLRTLFFEIFIKAGSFVLLTAFIYILFSFSRGSFGGSALLAIEAVPVTLISAVKFENLVSVYLYSLVISSFPIYVVILIKMMIVNKRFSMIVRGLLFWLPFETKPLRAVSTVFAIFTGMFSIMVSLVVTPFA